VNDLREVTREPYFLEKAGFLRRDEETTDVDRWVWYERTIDSIESQVTLILQVEFEMSISDNPFVRTSDNFCYSFNGVYLKVIERQMERWDSQSYDEEAFMRLAAGVDPTIISDGAIIGAAKLARTSMEFGKWSAEMMNDLGGKIQPYLKAIWEASNKKLDERLAKVEARFKKPHIPPLDVLMEEGPREIDRFELKVSTLAQLRSLCKMLGAKSEAVG